MTAIEIPPRMRRLPLDKRGYPVPVIILWTEDGRPIFAANDAQVVLRCHAEDRCHICGERLARGRWLVSGHYSALAENGTILDGPLHDECCHYAMRVCPYIAAPEYGKLVAKKQIAGTDRAGILTLPTPTDGLPRPIVFVAQMTVALELRRNDTDPFDLPSVRPRPGSVRKVEFWRHGEQITDSRAIAALIEGAREVLARQGAGGLRPDTMQLLNQGRNVHA